MRDFQPLPGKRRPGQSTATRWSWAIASRSPSKNFRSNPGWIARDPAREGQTTMLVAVDGAGGGLPRCRGSDPWLDPRGPSTSAGRRAAHHHANGRQPHHGGSRRRPALGIDEVVAEVLPSGENAVVAACKAKATSSRWPAMASMTPQRWAQAHVGIGMGTGTDVAMESAPSRWCTATCVPSPALEPEPRNHEDHIRKTCSSLLCTTSSASPWPQACSIPSRAFSSARSGQALP